jgi:hypothetical protein
MQHDTERAGTRLIPITKWPEHHDWPPVGGLRHLRFHAEPRVNSRGEVIPGNGFASAFKTVGARVLVDESEFFRCVDARNNGEHTKAVGV